MKQFITLLFIAAFSTTFANTLPTENEANGFVYLSGNTTSAGSSETYYLTSTDFNDVLYINSVFGAHITGYFQGGFGTNQAWVTVYFEQCASSTRSTNLFISYTQNGLFRSLSQGVTISAGGGSGGIGPISISTGTTGSYPLQYYTFTANALGGTTYSWSVTGGTISGSSAGSTINVAPSAGSCSITANVTVSNSCGDSGTQQSTRTISAPVYVGDISGPQEVGRYYGDYSGYTSSAYVPNGSLHEYVWSVSGPFQLGGNGTNQVFVFVNTYNQYGSGNLYVYVKNTCGQTITKSKYITVNPTGIPGGTPPGGGSGWVTVDHTKVVSNSGNLKLIVPNFEEKDIKIFIYDLQGNMIEKFSPNTFEVPMNRSKYKKGIYVVKTISSKENSTSKFTVSDL